MTKPFSLKELKKELQGSKGLIKKARETILPSGEVLAKEARRKVSFSGKHLTPEDVVENFDTYLCELVDKEYEIYLEYENKKLSKAVTKLALDPSIRKEFPLVYNMMKSALKTLRKKYTSDILRLAEIGEQLRPFYKVVEQSFSQGRMARAGGSSQYHLKALLDLAGYKSEYVSQQALNGTVDFLFPNLEVWKEDRQRCVIVSIKRTLRERYKQVFEELDITKGMTIYLFVTETLQESLKDIADPKVNTLRAHNIYLVVRDEIKNRRFSDKPNVIGFSFFIQKDLPSKRLMWQHHIKKGTTTKL